MSTTNGKISLRDVYEIVYRLEDKLDKRMCHIEDRVDNLEDFKSRILGVTAFVSAFVGSIAAWTWNRITGGQ